MTMLKRCRIEAQHRTQRAWKKITNDVILKRFDDPDEVRTFEKGKFELVHLGGMTIGRASYFRNATGHPQHFQADSIVS